jgi:hypothetical protein
MLAVGEQRRVPGEDTTLERSAEARAVDVVVVALRLSSGRVTVAAAGVTLDGVRG